MKRVFKKLAQVLGLPFSAQEEDSSSPLSPMVIHSPIAEEKLLSQTSSYIPPFGAPISPRDDSGSPPRDDSSPLLLSKEEKVDVPYPKRIPMARPGYANSGQPIPLITNLIGVNFECVHCEFFLYDVSISYEGGHMVIDKDIGKDVIKKLHELYDTDLDGINLAYDGKDSLLTIVPFPQNELEYTIVSEDISSYRTRGPKGSEDTEESERKRLRLLKRLEVHILFAAKVPLKDIADAVSENSQEALRALNIIFGKNNTQQGCVFRQSFSHDSVHNCHEIGGCKCFYYSFKATQGGLSVIIGLFQKVIAQLLVSVLR